MHFAEGDEDVKVVPSSPRKARRLATQSHGANHIVSLTSAKTQLFAIISFLFL
jgi:hypothetical protein